MRLRVCGFAATHVRYDGSHLASKHGCVVVSINYRLGSLGFGQFIQGQANFGLQDQRQALQFIQEPKARPRGSGRGGLQGRAANTPPPFIASFGGDPGRVMLFGESAGAISVAVHLVTPGSFGLFSTALVESGFPSAKPQQLALDQSRNLTRKLGCPVAPVSTTS